MVVEEVERGGGWSSKRQRSGGLSSSEGRWRWWVVIEEAERWRGGS